MPKIPSVPFWGIRGQDFNIRIWGLGGHKEAYDEEQIQEPQQILPVYR